MQKEVFLNHKLYSCFTHPIKITRLYAVIVLLLVLGLSLIPSSASCHTGTGVFHQQNVLLSPSLENPRISSIYLPKTIRLEWSASFSPAVAEHSPIGGTLSRVDHDTGQTLDSWGIGFPTTKTSYVHNDSFDFVSGKRYDYYFYIPAGGDLDLYPAPHAGSDPNAIYTRHYWDAATVILSATPIIVTASDNQAVDSRLDLRYADNHPLDFQFGNIAYRGGLFAGFANDSGKIGRSFLKFSSLSTLPQSENLWTGSVNAYYLRSNANGTTNVGCLNVTDSWDQNTIVWTNSPSVTPSSAINETAVTYDSANPTPMWCNWNMTSAINNTLSGDHTLSVCLASKNESSAGWAYFAKKEYDTAMTPTLLYVYGNAPLIIELLSVSVNPTSVRAGNTSTGTVTIDTPAPSGGVIVNLSSSLTSLAQVPTTVTVPQGATSANFTINTYYWGPMTMNVTITATKSGVSKTAVLTVTPF